MSLSAKECWKSLITRYGPPLEPDSLDEDTLKLAIAEKRALVTWRIADGYGSGELYFRRAQMGDRTQSMIVFPRPCEITDEEVTALDEFNPWESGSDLARFTHELLSPACWKSLITRYGPPLEPDSLDEDTLKQAIAEKRALKVVEIRYSKRPFMYFERANVGDTIRGFFMRDRPYFCIVFAQPCEITDKEATILTRFFFERWDEMRELTDARFTVE